MKQQEMNELLIFFCELGRLESVIQLLYMGADPTFNRHACLRYAKFKQRHDVIRYLESILYRTDLHSQPH